MQRITYSINANETVKSGKLAYSVGNYKYSVPLTSNKSHKIGME